MKRRCFAAIILLVVFAPMNTNAVPIGHYPGLKKLIDSAEAIVILRIDRHLSDFNSPTFYSTHECYIYQSIKGDIPKNTRINLQLMNTEGSFATPYAHGSTHLMFLMKKATEDEPTEYRTLTFKGAQILLSPLGNEKPPEGKTIEDRIENLIKDAIAYQAEEHEKKERFLKAMLGQQEAGEPSAPAGGSAETNTPLVRSSIPYVATRNDAVRDMLWMSNVGKDDVVYDLGSGDGRIVNAAVRDFGARRAVGIEIDPERIRESRENAQKAGVTDRVEFIQGDLFTNDFRQASVVTLFLGNKPNINLRPKMLRILKPGTRIVSQQFGMGEWQTDKTQTVRTVYFGMWGEAPSLCSNNPNVPDYTGNESHFGTSDKILMWVVPAPVAGIWRGKIETAQGPQDLKLILHQRLSKVTGKFQLSGHSNLAGGVVVDLWGDHVRFWCWPRNVEYGRFEIRFDGHVQENTLRGTLTVKDHGQLQESSWEAQREKVDYTGTWEWPCATGTRSVRLRIEQGDGHLIATYLDRNQALPVTDFYDFGGGFYFTLLPGRKGALIRITKDTGWLIGEAVLDAAALEGKIEFHPYAEMSGMPGGAEASRPVLQNWAPRLIKP